ncbi:vomeronasal type-1 receptor 90-like [Sciurus carolinensis]|uniref:vomeronasal type-1 receptor 90-like n=1 Tax=Sciurus carolinensis TaxID=30640 RepID=UPI001FB27601|nr:vomeronasal type-1 receptor 90-like [Sciurus carolinensis]
MKKNDQLYDYTSVKNAFFFEIGIGIPANTILFFFHVFMFLLQHKLNPIDLIIGLLALIHLGMLTILLYIITNKMLSQYFWDDIKCKSIIYLNRFLRGFSICATCLLSVLQAITLSPRTSSLAKFKQSSTSDPVFPCFLVGLLYVLQYSLLILCYCYLQCALRDVFLIGLMALSSVYMVTLLCRHKRHFQHLHSSKLSPKASPLQKATSNILLLMSFFVLMYCLDSIFSSSRTMWNNDPVCHYIHLIVSNGYATINPLLLICTDKHIINFFKYYLVKIPQT